MTARWTSTVVISLAALAGVFAAAVVRVGHATGRERAVPGPESDKLLPATTGYVVINQPPGGMTAIRLPDLAERVVRAAAAPDPRDTPTIHALSGPDADGRIAYVEDHFFVADPTNRRHLLKTVRLDGTHDVEVFARPGDAMWAKTAAGHGEIGAHLALSPVRGRVAFLSGLRPVQMPSVYLHVGTVEVWDVEKKAGRPAGVEALDEGLAWFPDGRRLAYVKLVARDAAPGVAERRDTGAGTFGNAFGRWNQVPAVVVRDVDAGTETFLHVGWRPVVSADGRQVLVSDLAGSWARVEVATGKAETVTWPGVAGRGAIAWPAPDLVLSWGLPTQGEPIRYTGNNSPLNGPKEMLTLKLAGLGSGEFQTVVPYLDPRASASFGRVKAGEVSERKRDAD